VPAAVPPGTTLLTARVDSCMRNRVETRGRSSAGSMARVKKAYRILFGRDPRPEELSAGLEYLSAEPLRTYEERKLADAKKKDTKDGEGTKEKASKPAPKPEMGEGMMAGVTKPGGATEDDKKKMLPVTPLGRYLKVLLSSSEFLFVD